MAGVSGTFTSATTSGTITGTAIDVSLSGGASATVAIQRNMNGSWVTIESITGDAERVVENATGLSMRLNCTSYTSGTVTYSMVSR